jgi:ABC-type Co2+ transport system permease subunit
MHIPDGYLGPATYGGAWAVMLPIWRYASKKVRQTVQTSEIPFLAMGTVFSLVAMMFMLPLPGGTTGHISGTTLVAILLGPWAAVIAVSISVVIQAVLLGDGGITAIAANCFNIAFIGAVLGWGIYALILRVGAGPARWRRGGSDTAPAASLSLRLTAAAVASYAAINLGALMAALELGSQPLLYAGSQGAAYFPFPLKVAIPAVMVPHLTMIGALEAGVTVLVLTFVHRTEGTMKGLTKAAVMLCVCLTGMLSAASGFAHDYWIEKDGASYAVVYGHGNQRMEYDPANVKRVTVYDAAGKPIAFQTEVQGKILTIKPAGPPSVIVAELDRGYWSKTISGWKHVPKRQAAHVVEAVRSYDYSKSIVSWGDAAQKPMEGVKLDLVPQENPFDVKVGDTLPVKVVYGGKPLAGAEVEGDDEKVTTTDSEGIARVPLKKGRIVISVDHREPLKDDPDADFVSVTTTLTLEVPK